MNTIDAYVNLKPADKKAIIQIAKHSCQGLLCNVDCPINTHICLSLRRTYPHKGLCTVHQLVQEACQKCMADNPKAFSPEALVELLL